MKMFRYVYVATFLFAVAIAFIVNQPMWVKLVVLTWTATPVLINEYHLKKRATAAAEQAEHALNSLPDQMLHAYKDNS
jgi:Flp pilus assembly protein TadB